ncbi:MAG: hypothetical protein Q8K50_04730 [Hydrogenophaga sp.]|nr:hypothetical protein [Hydrogenophaga sp.]
MYPIQMQEGSRGIGMGYTQFIEKFTKICRRYLSEGRARAFAFVFYDMGNSVVRRALSEAQGFQLLHERTGKDITLFYLHDSAVSAHWQNFNKEFMAALGVQNQAEPPCMVFFRVRGEQIEDVSIYNIDEQTQDPVLVTAELVQYVDDAIRKMNAEGNFSVLTDFSKAVAPISALFKVGEFLSRLKGVA